MTNFYMLAASQNKREKPVSTQNNSKLHNRWSDQQQICIAKKLKYEDH